MAKVGNLIGIECLRMCVDGTLESQTTVRKAQFCRGLIQGVAPLRRLGGLDKGKTNVHKRLITF